MDPVRIDFKERTRLQAYSCFYPQQRIVTKFMERNCDSLATILWRTAYPDVDHEQVVEEIYGVRLSKHLRYLPHINERETFFDPEYTYKRAEIVGKFARQHQSTDSAELDQELKARLDDKQ